MSILQGIEIRFGKPEVKMELPSDALDKTLEERINRYGSFETQADIFVPRLKQLIQQMHKLKNYQILAIIQDDLKTSRILNGDPDYVDNWHDKAGVARLVERILLGVDL